MGLLSIIKAVVLFPFRLVGKIFRRGKKEDVEDTPLQPPTELPPPPFQQGQYTPGQYGTPRTPQQQPPMQPEPQRQEPRNYPTRDEELSRTKLDLIIAELDTLKSLNQSLSERIKIIEQKLDEKNRGIRYV